MTGPKWIMAKSTYKYCKTKRNFAKILTVWKSNHKVCSKNQKLYTFNMKYQSPQKWQKKNIFFQRRYILKHKRKRHNLKGPRAARSCLVTSKKGLYSWPTTCWVVEFHNLTDEITHTYVSMLFYSEWQLTFNKTLLV